MKVWYLSQAHELPEAWLEPSFGAVPAVFGMESPASFGSWL